MASSSPWCWIEEVYYFYNDVREDSSSSTLFMVWWEC